METFAKHCPDGVPQTVYERLNSLPGVKVNVIRIPISTDTQPFSDENNIAQLLDGQTGTFLVVQASDSNYNELIKKYLK